MANWLVDNFTAADGTALTSHAADTGTGSWGSFAGANDVLSISNNRLYHSANSGSGQAAYVHSQPAGAVDQMVSMVWHPFSNLGKIGGILRGFHCPYYDFTTGTWTISYIGSGTVTGLLNGVGGTVSAVFSDPGRFTLGVDTPVSISEVGNTIAVNVNGTQVFTFAVQGGFQLAGAGTNGVSFLGGLMTASTGVHIDSIIGGPSAVAATGYTITGPSVCGVGVPTPADATSRGGVLGPFAIKLTPVGGVLGSDFTVTLSDAASGAFSATPKVVAGQNVGYFTFTAASAGPKTITSTETSANGFGVKTATTTAVPDVLAVAGNSVSDNIGGNLGNGTSWPNLIQGILGNAWYVHDVAVTGNTTVDQTARYAGDLGSIVGSIVGRKLLVFWEMANDISVNNPSPTAAQAWAHVQTYLSGATGWQKILVTAMPRSGSFAVLDGVQNTSGFNARAAAANVLMRAGWGTSGAVALLDLSSDSRFTDATVSANFTDGAHLSLTMYGYVAEMVTGLLGMITNGGAYPSGGGGGGGGPSSASHVLSIGDGFTF